MGTGDVLRLFSMVPVSHGKSIFLFTELSNNGF